VKLNERCNYSHN